MSENKTHWRKCDKSDYLGACDLEDSGDLTAVIKEVKIETVKLKGKDDEARVAYFKEDMKPMIVNVGNGKILKKFAKSSFVEDWKNIPVWIFVKDDVRVGGEVTDGLRFRESHPRLEKEIMTSKHKLWPKLQERAKAFGETPTDEQKNELLADITKHFTISDDDFNSLLK